MKRILILLMACFLHSQAIAQKNSFSFGFNTSYFSDWKGHFTIFQPELSYARAVTPAWGWYASSHFLIDSGENKYLIYHQEGDITRRTILAFDLGALYQKNRWLLGAGPCLRYRQESVIGWIAGPRHFIAGPMVQEIDLGLCLQAQYRLPVGKKSFLACKAAYRLYEAGVSPASLGLHYGWKF